MVDYLKSGKMPYNYKKYMEGRDSLTSQSICPGSGRDSMTSPRAAAAAHRQVSATALHTGMAAMDSTVVSTTHLLANSSSL